MAYTEAELKIQQSLVKALKNLEKEVENKQKQVRAAGWQQRSALITHVNSDYEKDKELNEYRKKWEILTWQANTLEWLFELFKKYRDEYGYFPEYDKMLSDIDILIDTSINKEEFEITAVLVDFKSNIFNDENY